MSFPWNQAAIAGRHTVSYRTRDAHRGDPVRETEVLATPSEIETLMRDGYLVRRNIISPADVERLRAATEEVLAREGDIESGSQSFGGAFLRHLIDKHPAFLEMLDFAPALSVARAVFGPSVALRGMTARLCRPGEPHSEVEWHHHQRMVPDPLPPMWSAPQTLDALLYLDDVNDGNGPLFVVPGSHRWHETDLPTGQTADKENQVKITFPAGSMVLAFGSLWHRAQPTDGTRDRRLIIFGYSPAWQKPAIYGRKPAGGLTDQLLENGADEETRELLGVAGYM